jgi:hypothetical protein
MQFSNLTRQTKLFWLLNCEDLIIYWTLLVNLFMKIYHEVLLFKTDRYLVILILSSILCTLTLKTYSTRLFHINIFVLYLFETLTFTLTFSCCPLWAPSWEFWDWWWRMWCWSSPIELRIVSCFLWHYGKGTLYKVCPLTSNTGAIIC